MVKTLGMAMVVVAGTLIAEHEARACSPPGGPTTPEIVSAQVMVKDHLAKNVGIPIKLTAYGVITPELVRARLVVEVRAGATVLDGALEPIGTPGSTLYRWKSASGDTPAGTLSVSMTVTGATNAGAAPGANTAPATITVDDRVAAAQPTNATITVGRDIVEDESAPAILCTRTHGIGECSSGTYDSKVSTRWIGVPVIAATLAAVRSPDDPLVDIATELFGRDKNGTRSHGPNFVYTDLGPDLEPTVAHGRLDRAYAEYCITTTTTIRGLPDAAVATICAAPSVDLSVSNDEAVSRIREQTTGCDATTYPDGTSDDDPTGEGGGCAVTPRGASHPVSELALALAVALIVARKRRQR